MSLRLKNPHSILAALQTRPQDVFEIRLPKRGGGAEAWDAVRDMAELHRIPHAQGRSIEERRGHRRQKGGGRQDDGGREGAGEAGVRELPGVTLGELFAGAQERAGGCGLWLALDCIQDPHNIGAIIRTAAFFGVQGLLLTADRSAPLSSTVYDVAAGGMEYLSFTVQTNLVRSLEIAKEAGVWTLGSSEHAEMSVDDVPRDRPWLLLIGNEAKGLRRLTSENCDQICRITPRGGVTSLNASVAAGIMIAKLAGG